MPSRWSREAERHGRGMPSTSRTVRLDLDRGELTAREAGAVPAAGHAREGDLGVGEPIGQERERQGGGGEVVARHVDGADPLRGRRAERARDELELPSASPGARASERSHTRRTPGRSSPRPVAATMGIEAGTISLARSAHAGASATASPGRASRSSSARTPPSRSWRAAAPRVQPGTGSRACRAPRRPRRRGSRRRARGRAARPGARGSGREGSRRWAAAAARPLGASAACAARRRARPASSGPGVLDPESRSVH